MEMLHNFEYAAVRYVLAAPQIAERTVPYLRDGDFDFAGLEQESETMSNGERLLVRIARELWLAEKTTGLWQVVRQLDRGNFVRVLEALRIARGDYAWDVVCDVLAGDARLAA
ncbi:MAG TPA: hypothetical protein VNY33_04125 [Gaiellaceae bacterium]|jgi:hypothetical protein|nr:hypothetical protein [Gaiellaceae bacterium]